MEIYAQAGGKVILQREKHGQTVENLPNVYVNWFRGSEKTPIISRNPQAGIPGAETNVFDTFFAYATIISRVL